MDDLSERAALVALLRNGQRSWTDYARLVEEAGSATALLTTEQNTLFGADDQAAARADIEGWRAQGFDLLMVLDPGYPQNLRAVHDRPPFVFVQGELAPQDSRAIAVIGSRKATSRGIDAARRVAALLVDRGYVVVSGLAAGIDTAAHSAALARKGRTIAVIGTGLTRAYPPQNAELQARIAREGAVISQFWPESPPSRTSFPMRNAVMSGLSLATVVVEAGPTSGARLQARLALHHGRPVFLPEPLVRAQPWAREFARRPGTYVVRSPAEIADTVARLTAPDALVG
jgi:DNA processing protein